MKEFIKRHWFIIISIIYIIWPLDLIAEVFGPIGLIDDVGILIAAVVKEVYEHNKAEPHKKKEAD